MTDPYTTHTVLVAHSDRDARVALAAELDLDGYVVHEANSAANATGALARVKPDALLLGALERPVAAPALLRGLRAGQLKHVAASLPVITLGASDQVTQLRAYEDGSDHHLAEVVPYAIARAIIAAVLRRCAAAPSAPRQRFEIDGLVVDVTTRRVTVDGTPVPLPAMEYELLRALAAEPDRVFTKAELLDQVWGGGDPRSTRTLDSHACRLRKRLADHGQHLVLNHWGVGYALTDPPRL